MLQRSERLTVHKPENHDYHKFHPPRPENGYSILPRDLYVCFLVYERVTVKNLCSVLVWLTISTTLSTCHVRDSVELFYASDSLMSNSVPIVTLCTYTHLAASYPDNLGTCC